MQLHFYKYQGTGNDFIILDNRKGLIELSPPQIEYLCHRRWGIGADGLMLLEEQPGLDFKMVYFNADGYASSMCGNGGRCLVRFANDIGLHKDTYNFAAVDGVHEAAIDFSGAIRLKMKAVHAIESHAGFDVLDTGSPHLVKIVSELNDLDVATAGRNIRNSAKFLKDGINVNFVERVNNSLIFVRTYERGVEDETLSCGTGVTAAALVNAHNERGFNHMEVQTKGGKLSVEFDKLSDTSFQDIWLIGPAVQVFQGDIAI